MEWSHDCVVKLKKSVTDHLAMDPSRHRRLLLAHLQSVRPVFDIRIVDFLVTPHVIVDFAMWQNALIVRYLVVAMMLYVCCDLEKRREIILKSNKMVQNGRKD